MSTEAGSWEILTLINRADNSGGEPAFFEGGGSTGSEVTPRGAVKALRILVADDHELIRRGIRSLLEARPGWAICGEAATGRDAVEKANLLQPDVVIMDISMPDLNGLEATRQIMQALPNTEVLILTIHDSENLEREVLAAGAHGYVLKSDEGRDLVTAIESLCEHRPFLTARLAKTVLENFLRTGTPVRNQDPGRDPLSPREREVVQLLAEGKSNKEAATVLGISVRTVENHRVNSFRKLNLHSISDLVHYAIRNNLVTP